jgi:hypothetical protein
VDVNAVADAGDTPLMVSVAGTWDPRAGTAALAGTYEDERIEVRVVAGRTYVLWRGEWLALDTSHLPVATPTSVLAALALADPAIPVAAARATVAGVQQPFPPPGGAVYEVAVDVASFAAAAPDGDLVRRLLPYPSMYERAETANGRLATTAVTAGNVNAGLTVTATGVPKVAVTAPARATTVDVATYRLTTRPLAP